MQKLERENAYLQPKIIPAGTCVSVSVRKFRGRSQFIPRPAVGPTSLWFPEKGQRREGGLNEFPTFSSPPLPQARGGYCITHALHERKGVGFWLRDKLTEK